MTSHEIRKIPLSNDLSKTFTTTETMALDFQITQLILLQEIAAQLAEMNEAYRYQKGMK